MPESSAATADEEAKFGYGEDTAPLAESSAIDKLPPGGRCHMCVGFDHLLVTYGDDGNGHRCVVCKMLHTFWRLLIYKSTGAYL